MSRPNATLPAAGRDELNLIDFPIGTLQYQQPLDKQGRRPEELTCAVEAYDHDLQRSVTRRLTRRTSSRHGFPTPLEDEVLVGLLTLARLKNDFQSPRVAFLNSELFTLMAWPHTGQSTDRLAVALDRLAGLTLKYENAWSTQSGQFAKVFTTGLIESYQLTRQTAGRRQPESERTWIQWASEVFADIQRGNVKELNTHEFFSLVLPLSQRLYRFLDKRLSTEPRFTMDLAVFAAQVGLAETSHVGKIKERLREPLAELESLPGFIVPAGPRPRFRKRARGQWTIEFERQAPQTDAAPRHRTASLPVGAARTDDRANDLVRAFYRAWKHAEHHQPTPREIAQARVVIEQHGDQALAGLPKIVRRMQQDFPQARAFGATLLFWQDLKPQPTPAAVPLPTIRNERQPASDQDSAASAARARRAALETRWQSLSAAEQDAIRVQVAAHAGPTVQRLLAREKFGDPLVKLACLEELQRRQHDQD